MSPPRVFDFNEFAGYLAASRSRLGRRPTLARWAAQLGYRSPRSIAMVLKGQRAPTVDMVRRLSEWLEHSDTEHRYLELLVARERCRRRQLPTDTIERRLQKLRPHASGRRSLDETAFCYVSDWFHLVIRQLSAAPGFRPRPGWIAKKLRRKITATEAARSLRVLGRLGLLGGEGGIRSSEDVPSAAVRRHHEQMLERAREALYDLPPEKREFGAMTLRLDPARLREAKAELRNFRRTFAERFESPRSQHVFQLGLQLFPHTEVDGEG